jgi:hypothetical protein
MGNLLVNLVNRDLGDKVDTQAVRGYTPEANRIPLTKRDSAQQGELVPTLRRHCGSCLVDANDA